MAEKETTGLQRKRLNPYKGLIIDVPIWASAHDYHREQQKLHTLSLHRPGVATGLEVVSWEPADNSVVIYPGIAVDPEGNTIVVTEPQRFYLNMDEKGLARIILRYSEIEQDMIEVPGEVKPHPLYILEGFRIEERREEPGEPYIELARVAIEGKGKSVKDADDPSLPGSNELDTRYRTTSGPKPEGELTMGILVYPGDNPVSGWDCHRQGVLNLAQSIRRSTGYIVKVMDMLKLDEGIKGCDLLFITGHEEFSLSEVEEEALTNYFDRGGILFAEACGGITGSKSGGAKGFRSSFAGLCDKLGRNLRTIEMDHPVFHSYHIFGSLPPGHDGQAVVMMNNGIIYSDCDYGCVWQGGRKDNLLPRGNIRDAIDFGINIALYSHQKSRLQELKLGGR